MFLLKRLTFYIFVRSLLLSYISKRAKRPDEINVKANRNLGTNAN